MSRFHLQITLKIYNYDVVVCVTPKIIKSAKVGEQYKNTENKILTISIWKIGDMRRVLFIHQNHNGLQHQSRTCSSVHFYKKTRLTVSQFQTSLYKEISVCCTTVYVNVLSNFVLVCNTICF